MGDSGRRVIWSLAALVVPDPMNSAPNPWSGMDEHAAARRIGRWMRATTCRYCFELGARTRPCACTAPLHRDCLLTWMRASGRTRCPECAAFYRLRLSRDEKRLLVPGYAYARRRHRRAVHRLLATLPPPPSVRPVSGGQGGSSGSSGSSSSSEDSGDSEDSSSDGEGEEACPTCSGEAGQGCCCCCLVLMNLLFASALFVMCANLNVVSAT